MFREKKENNVKHLKFSIIQDPYGCFQNGTPEHVNIIIIKLDKLIYSQISYTSIHFHNFQKTAENFFILEILITV